MELISVSLREVCDEKESDTANTAD